MKIRRTAAKTVHKLIIDQRVDLNSVEYLDETRWTLQIGKLHFVPNEFILASSQQKISRLHAASLALIRDGNSLS